MHVHSTQPNPYAALDALRSAQKTAAKREAEMVRKELMESASEIAGDAEMAEMEDTCVLQVDSRRQSQQQSKRRNRQGQRNSQPNTEPAVSETDQPNSEPGEDHLSDWA
jgi:hypothetical protein